MTDFIVLHQYGPGSADLEVCGLFVDRKATEGEEVIREGMTKGTGEYLAVPLSSAVRRTASQTLELRDPEGE